MSLGLSESSLTVYDELEEACYYARKHDVILVSAAGNQGNIGYAALFNNQWIIPVAGCDDSGRLSPESNFGASIGKRGLMGPGVNVRSTSPIGEYRVMSGTSFAASFVIGTIALLWSLFQNAAAKDIIYSILSC